jgi:hypothetical protein
MNTANIPVPIKTKQTKQKETKTMKTNAIIAALIVTLNAGLNAATKTVTTGNSMFGATMTGTLDYYSPPNGGSCTFYGSGRVDGKVLYKSVNLASAQATLKFNHGSNVTTTTGYLKAGSKTLTSWNKTFNGSGSFATAPLVLAQAGGSFDFLEVVTVSASASAELRMVGNVNMVTLPGNKTSISASFGPAVKVGATASGSVDIWLASAGVTGSLTLCEASLLASARMTPNTDVFNPNSSIISYRADFTTRTPSGSLAVWYDTPATYKKYHTIFKWTGYTSTANLASGSFVLKGGYVLR